MNTGNHFKTQTEFTESRVTGAFCQTEPIAGSRFIWFKRIRGVSFHGYLGERHIRAQNGSFSICRKSVYREGDLFCGGGKLYAADTGRGASPDRVFFYLSETEGRGSPGDERENSRRRKSVYIADRSRRGSTCGSVWEEKKPGLWKTDFPVRGTTCTYWQKL